VDESRGVQRLVAEAKGEQFLVVGSGRITLRATIRCKTSSCAAQTSAIPPEAMRLSSRYRSPRTSPGVSRCIW
jgi:hypothetical protein